MKFKDYIKEDWNAKKDTVVVLNGRMNPPTKGHEENINGMVNFANNHNADNLVIASHSHDNKKNPLNPEQKLTHLRRAFPDVNIKTSSKESPTIFHQLSHLHDQGYKHVVLAAGADRTEDYERIKQYNGKHGKHGYYNFKSISTASTGERQAGISGTDMRNHVTNDNFKEFKKNLPSNLAANNQHAKELFNDVKTGLSAQKEKPAAKPKKTPASFAYTPVNEDYENPFRFDWGTPEGTKYMQSMNPAKPTECVMPGEVWSKKKGMCVAIREAYINDEIFRLNEVVESNNGQVGPIVFRGSTYVTMKLQDGATVKHWLKDIKEFTGEIKEQKVVHEPVITYKKKFGEHKVAALLMSKAQLTEMVNGGMELEYQGYKTSNLHVCSSASEQLKELIKKPLNPKYILQAVQASDAYLEIEKKAKAQGFANEQIVHDFLEKFAIAHDTLNMLGYPDKQLMYMENHLRTMSELSMHRDGTFANETGSTVTTYGIGDTSESVIMDKSEKQRKEKVPMKNNYSKFRKKIHELYEPDPPTHSRDINFKADKDVFHGIDKPMSDELNYDGKPAGLVSFKSFMDIPTNQKLQSYHDKDRQDVHRAQVELGQHSSAYKMMRKAKLQEP
jgi:hypothetical protein